MGFVVSTSRKGLKPGLNFARVPPRVPGAGFRSFAAPRAPSACAPVPPTRTFGPRWPELWQPSNGALGTCHIAVHPHGPCGAVRGHWGHSLVFSGQVALGPHRERNG